MVHLQCAFSVIPESVNRDQLETEILPKRKEEKILNYFRCPGRVIEVKEQKVRWSLHIEMNDVLEIERRWFLFGFVCVS